MTKENRPAVKTRSSWFTLLRIVLIVLFLIIALVGGMVVGYVVFGKQELGEVWEWSTWRHVLDLVFAP